MPREKQDQFAMTAKKRLVERGWTVTQLAERVGRSRTATSIAIHHPTMFEGTRKLIRKELSITC